ncbi:patched family domain-containing protein [Ditylenchus destructor]|uniref:Patched family domain-containing protein n=1 Tax=Ditylenchus destructor TaxID=166010 RepID=A0AAD4R9N8_9BILA|nr:patched family domain-containing protein [Ditylenchus destructor]
MIPCLSGGQTDGETHFVRLLNRLFRRAGTLFIFASVFITLITSSIIPFTEMVNDVSDFTPNTARARHELETYTQFFSNKGEPIALYVLITAKKHENMLGIRQLEETIRLLNITSERFKVYNSFTQREESFSEFCHNFCTINEPVRHFYNGLLVESNFGNSSDHIDLGYPITTVLGRQLHVDPNFFGVKVAFRLNSNNETREASVNQLRSTTGQSVFDLKGTNQIKNNIREIKLIVLQFRAERPPSISMQSVKQWENDILAFVQHEFKSEWVDAYVLSESFLTSEVVRAGLTLLPFLVIGFTIMVVFSSITISLAALYIGQMAAHKILLAIVACVCPFMACGTALGAMFWCGFRFGSILCVTPFLVLALGVDDAYIMLNSWQRLRKTKQLSALLYNFNRNRASSTAPCSSPAAKLSGKDIEELSEEMFAHVMVDTGASITITTATNVLAFIIGALTPTPEIQIFSIGNALAITAVYIYAWTVFGSLMAIVGRWELVECLNDPSNDSGKELVKPATSNSSALISSTLQYQQKFLSCCSRFVAWYCRLITNPFVASLVVALLAGYIYITIYGILTIKAELKPEQLFLRSSDVIKVLDLRNEYIMPFYAICIVFVNNAGNVTNPLQAQKLHSLFWRGFVTYEDNGTENGDVSITKFFFTTASYGIELRDWSKREELLNQWRHVADSYPELEVSVYEDDAKFLDLIPTMIPQTAQSAMWTLLCMFLVCLLFMTHPTTLIVSNFAIFSTCVGVFGILSLIGTELDPIVMSAAIMSIGFSVDIPAHIAYHFYKTGLNSEKQKTVEERLRHCISAIGFPVFEAGISTIICVSSLTFVNLHMAQVFARTLILVVAIGLVHGLLVIPVLFYLISLIPTTITFGSRRPSEMDIPETKMQTEISMKDSNKSSSGGILTIRLSANNSRF